MDRRLVEPEPVNDGDLTCPQCGHSNPPNSGYCWECRFDLVPDAVPRRPIPPPYSSSVAEVKAAGEHARGGMFVIGLLFSTLIVWGTWAFFSWLYPSIGIIAFALGWTAVLMLVGFTERLVPRVETDLNEYWSWNPFEFRDDRNRAVLNWHIMTFLPRIVLSTLRQGYTMVASPR